MSSALLLQEAGYSVTIVAKDFPAPFETIDRLAQINFASPWAGAHNRWVPPSPSGENAREHALSLNTFTHMRTLASDTAAGSKRPVQAVFLPVVPLFAIPTSLEHQE